jgi:putative SOS response-associated peptidase YedK
MCGRYTSSVPKAMLRERFEVEVPEDYEQRYNLAPGQRALAIRERNEDGREAGMLRWGLIPPWAKDT